MITVLPLFYQELLGYTAFNAGLVVGPRGLGSIVGMPVIGFLGDKLDARYLLTFGFIVFGVTSLIFGNVDLSIGPTTLLVAHHHHRLCAEFCLRPDHDAAYGTLRNEQIGNASGIFNLVRNIGGSIGISVAQTLLTRRSDFHQNQITNYVPRTQTWLQQQTSILSRPLGQDFNPANAMHSALARLYQELGQQALLWAFVDVFRWMALLAFGCVPLVWLFRKVKPGKKTVAAH